MQYTDERYHLRVEIDTKQCTIPPDELVRMQRSLTPLGEAVAEFAASELRITVIHHPRSQTYHVEAKLKVPGRTLFTGDWDAYQDSAFQRCLRKLLQKVADYKENPDRRAEQIAARERALDQTIVAPEAPDLGPLAAAIETGDYKAFRTRLALYEDWIRKRVGRWVQRYPEAEARVGNGLALGDLVEEVYLNAFERYGQRPPEVSFHDWLDSLIDPSLKALLRHPDEERESISLAQTLRDAPLT